MLCPISDGAVTSSLLEKMFRHVSRITLNKEPQILLRLRYSHFALSTTYLVQQMPEAHENSRMTNYDTVLKSIVLGKEGLMRRHKGA
jgi:hypothetical protein